MTYHNLFERPFLIPEDGLFSSERKGVKMGNSVSGFTDREFAYSEAMSQWSMRYLDPSGFECILTLQAATSLEVLEMAEGAIAHLSDLKCLPSCHANGNGKISKTEQITEVKSDGKIVDPICPLHNVEMKLWTKGNRSWYSHRWEGGWCKGGRA